MPDLVSECFNRLFGGYLLKKFFIIRIGYGNRKCFRIVTESQQRENKSAFSGVNIVD